MIPQAGKHLAKAISQLHRSFHADLPRYHCPEHIFFLCQERDPCVTVCRQVKIRGTDQPVENFNRLVPDNRGSPARFGTGKREVVACAFSPSD